MKRILFIGFLSIFVLSGCNKVRKTSKQLDGTWTILSYSITENGGFITNYEAVGTITFTTSDDGSFNYQEDYSYATDTGTVVAQRTGSGILKGKKYRSYDLTLTNPSLFLEDCSIKVITKDDLKIVQHEPGSGHTYVLYKD